MSKWKTKGREERDTTANDKSKGIGEDTRSQVAPSSCVLRASVREVLFTDATIVCPPTKG